MSAYLDHAATTPLRPEALAAMLPYLTEHFGNASGGHSLARRARLALDEARDTVAECLACAPGEVVFTSGGTEACNLAVLGAGAGGGSVICSAVEHHAVLNSCLGLGGVLAPVDAGGKVDLDRLAELLHPEVGLVSVMLVNNEVGTIQPLAEVAGMVRERAPRALLHTDAVAAVGFLDVGSVSSVADLISVSAHKFGGPKGVGALIVRRGAHIGPVQYGGSQERGRRPGTEDVSGIVGMAVALAAAVKEQPDQTVRVGVLRDRLADGLTSCVDGLVETGLPEGRGSSPDRSGKVTSSCHLCVERVDQEELLVLLDEAGVCASGGAACASGALEPSHVLLAMGLSESRARTAVRFSLGYTTTEADVEHALAALPKAVERLRT